MQQVQDTYLGDGVYASFDGYHIILDLRAQDGTRISLEPAVLDALDVFRKVIADTFKGRADHYLPTPSQVEPL